jgi:hypothetical protein
MSRQSRDEESAQRNNRIVRRDWQHPQPAAGQQPYRPGSMAMQQQQRFRFDFLFKQVIYIQPGIDRAR